MSTPKPKPTDKMVVRGVTYIDEQYNIRNIDDSETRLWSILKEYYVRVKIGTLSGAFDPGDYEIQLKINSQDTGLYYQPTNPSVCHPEKPKTETGWKQLRPLGAQQWSTSFRLIRCAIGTGNEDLTMLVRLKDDKTGPVYSKRVAGKVPQARHRDGNYEIVYILDYRSVEGVPPSYSVATPDEAEAKKAVDKAADNWETVMDDAISIKHFSEVSDPNSTNTVISPYWRGSPGICRMGHALACMIVAVDADSHIIGSHLLKVSYPPGTPIDGETPQWTNDLDLAQDGNTEGLFYYLPNVMEHELGHAFGLGHARSRQHTMGKYDFFYLHLTTNDQHGMEQVIASHGD